MTKESYEKNHHKISVITATFNAIDHLPKLVESLRSQEDKDFQWVVADGLSTDGTLDLLREIADINITITSQNDFGIYDALNRGIKESSGDFYLVVGADDILFPNCIKDYKNAVEEGVDIVTAAIQINGKVFNARERPRWPYGMFNYVSGHAVGSLFKKALHERFGYYSRRFPIAADQLFVLNVCENGARVKRLTSLVGEFGYQGLSSEDTVGRITEIYRVQLLRGKNKFLHTLLLFMKLIKHYRKIK